MRLAFLPLLLLLLTSCEKDQLRWQSAPVRLASGTEDRLNDILVVSDSVILVAGGERFSTATILRSVDGGATWKVQSFPEAGKARYGIAVSATTQTVFSIGFGDRGLRSTDNGSSWRDYSHGQYREWKRLAFGAGGFGWMVGGVSFEAGCRARLNADGFIESVDSVGYELNDVLIGSDGTAYCTGYGIVQRLRVGEVGWTALPIAGDNFGAICQLSDHDLFVCGREGSIHHSTDGGESWKRLRTTNRFSQPFYALQDILFIDRQRGYCVGEDGLVIFTDDGGKHWSEFEHFTDAHLRSIARLPSGDLLVCGDGGELWRLKGR